MVHAGHSDPGVFVTPGKSVLHYLNTTCVICSKYNCPSKHNLIIINVTHISMFRNYSFNFGWNVIKLGRNMERRWERNIAEPKFELKSLHLSSCSCVRSRPYLRDREKIVFRCSETPSILSQFRPKVEEHITVTQGVT